MRKQVVKWEAKGVGCGVTRYTLRTGPRGTGKEIGAYQSVDSGLAWRMESRIRQFLEQEAAKLGYGVDTEETWNDRY